MVEINLLLRLLPSIIILYVNNQHFERFINLLGWGRLSPGGVGTGFPGRDLGFPPGREGTGFPDTSPVPSGNRDGTESLISRPVVPTGKGREGTGNAKKCQEIKNYFKGNN